MSHSFDLHNPPGIVVPKVQPLGDRVFVKKKPAEEKTPGGIFIPENVREAVYEGLLVAVGPGRIRKDGSRQEPRVRVGERVFFGKYTGEEVEVDGQKVLVLREDDLIAAVED